MLMTLLFACTARYAALPPMAPSELWSPLPVQTTEVAGTTVSWVDTGTVSEQTPLVLMHGLSASVGFWEHQLPDLATDRRILALDLPGYGRSGRPDAPYTPPWFAGVIVDWLDALGLDRVVLVGHSMGGQIALTMALDHPDRVQALVLSAPAGIETFSEGEARFIKDHWHEARALEATEHDLRAVFTTQVFNTHDPGVERLLEERVRLGAHPAFRGTSVAVSRSIAGMLDHPVRHRLGELALPVFVAFGSRDRMIPNPIFSGGRPATVLADAVALLDAEPLLVPGAGHTVHHDAPETFNLAVQAYLGGL